MCQANARRNQSEWCRRRCRVGTRPRVQMAERLPLCYQPLWRSRRSASHAMAAYPSGHSHATYATALMNRNSQSTWRRKRLVSRSRGVFAALPFGAGSAFRIWWLLPAGTAGRAPALRGGTAPSLPRRPILNRCVSAYRALANSVATELTKAAHFATSAIS